MAVMIGDAYEFDEASLPPGVKIGRMFAHGSYGYVHECSALVGGVLRTDLVVKCIPLDSPTLPNLGHDQWDFQDAAQRAEFSEVTNRGKFEREVRDSRKLGGSVAPALITSFVLPTTSQAHRAAGLPERVDMGCLVYERLLMTLRQMKTEYRDWFVLVREDARKQLVALLEEYWRLIGGPYVDLHEENVMVKAVPGSGANAGVRLYLIDLGGRPQRRVMTRFQQHRWAKEAEEAIYK